MPGTTDKTLAKMSQLFGADADHEYSAHSFLEKAGYFMNNDYTWTKPGLTELWEMTQDELACMIYLHEEWDYGLYFLKEAA